MSKSRQKTPITGVTTARSERDDKRIANRKLRRASRIAIGRYLRGGCSLDESSLVLPKLREVSNVWCMAKDGKCRWGWDWNNCPPWKLWKGKLPGMKVCKTCLERKPISKFSKNGRYYRGSCKQCENEKIRNSEPRQEQYRRKHFFTRYGITLEQYEAQLDKQGGVCAICCNPPTTRRLCVDHNHETGEVRGLICNSCNRGLGYLKDDSRLLKAAVQYLEYPPWPRL
jgi:hypothetical protein